MNFIIGTGYYNYNSSVFDDSTFLRDVWIPNTKKLNPNRIVIVNSNSEEIDCGNDVEWINLSRNPKHVKDMGKDESLFGGWSLSFINSAIYAYSCGCDFLYKEQDCLTFGDDLINVIYDKCKGKQMVTGELIDYPNKDYTIELSLMFLKRDFIPLFLSELMSINKTDGYGMRPEKKFLVIREKHPDKIGTFGFGYGGNRPFNKNDKVYYIQKPRWDYINKITYEHNKKESLFINEVENLKRDKLI